MLLRPSRQLLMIWFLASDLTATAAAWVLAYLARFRTGLPINKQPPTFDACLDYLPLVLGLAPLAYYLAGLYEVHRLRRYREELVSVAKGVFLLLLLVLALTYYRQDRYESRLTSLFFLGITLLGLLLSRRMWWGLLRDLRRRGWNTQNAVIVGAGRIARQTARALRHASWTGMRNLGFIEDQPSRWTSDLPILGGIADLPRLVRDNSISHVFIALPLKRYDEARRVFEVLSHTYADVRLVVDVPALAGVSLQTTVLDGLPILVLRENPHHGLNVVVKRAMDVALSLLAIILLSPVMLAVALLIKLTSRGPVLYRQERCGLNGKPFMMLKFRTMRADAELATGAVWAKANDPRRTSIGALLRQTSLDELPQLFNVLKGDMSLVGPRPERPVFIDKFKKTVPNYMVRHAMKAGITGWAQVNGWRGNTSLRKRLQHDLYYINHYSPWFDLRILFLTVARGIVNKNAY